MDAKLLAGFIALIVAIISFGSYSGITGYSAAVGSGVSLIATFITLIIALVMFAKYFKVIK